MRCTQTLPAAVLLLLAVVGILLLSFAKQTEMPPENMYGIVLDAGSSHTSMYIYKWPADKQNGTGIVTQHSECDVKGGGISSYAEQHGGAAKSLEACMEQAKKDIPKSRHHQTPLCLGATAGMRLLHMVNATESQRVLQEVENKLRSYPFLFKEARILSGQAEGAYGWITVNYLLENFVKYGFVGRWLQPGRDTVGALDLGGASTQITFETPEKVEDERNAMKLTLYGHDYKIYTQSFLCYGQDQFLRKLLAHLIKTQGVGPTVFHPCYPREFNTSIKLGADVFDSPCTRTYRPDQFDRDLDVTVVGTGDYQKCLNNVTEMLSYQTCNYSKCSFDGVFQPSVRGSFMAFSAFYFTQNYMTSLTNISITSPSDAAKAARLICNMTILEIMTKTNQRTVKHTKNICAMSNFIIALLTKGYHFDEASFPSISFTKKAGGASVGWALGYMLNVTNAVPAESLRVMKALTPGAWTSTLCLFITFMVFFVVFLVLIYRNAQTENNMI